MSRLTVQRREVKVTEVCCAIIKDGDKVLLAQRSELMSHPLMWEFPGGKRKPDESPSDCIKREIFEELNVEISIEQTLPPITHEYGSKRILLMPFICKLNSENILLKEHKSSTWIKKLEVGNFDLLEADLKVINTLNDHWK